MIPDLPGFCRLPCEANADCPNGQICGEGGVCRDDDQCADADGDAICDDEDNYCNPDGIDLNCRRPAPNCRAGTVPELVDGCYTDECVTWEQCGGHGGQGCVEDEDCAADQFCRDMENGNGRECVAYQAEGEVAAALPWAVRRCRRSGCSSFIPDAPGTCRVPSG